MSKYCLILCLITLLKSSSSIDLECAYNTNFDYSIVGKVYRCEVENDLQMATPDDAIVRTIRGQHWAYVGNNNVTGFCAYGKNMKFIPKNVENTFPNIKLIDIVNSRVKKIHQNDLKPFPKLVYCGFKDNEIQVLENGLFDYNLNLELVSFWNNRIIQVGPTVFNPLTKLTWLYFDDNPCLDMRVENNRNGVLNMIEKISENCNALNCSNSECDSGSKNEVQELKYLFNDLKNAHDSGFAAMTKTTEDLTERNQKLEKNLSEALEKIKSLELRVSKIEAENQQMCNKDGVNKNAISQQISEVNSNF
ncbi:chondroadherin-like [Chironomus tepperi]|uniref:chondroadherin-like n=1 Tax=Chironomus tepperi TaxID=113505 RepID=UPI00391F815D